MRLLRALTKAGGWLVMVLVLLAFIAWFTTPRTLGWQPHVVLSGSMEPALPVGSVAVVEPKRAEEIQTGDMLTFRNPNDTQHLVTHRVTEVVRGDGRLAFKTKGDANEVEDNWLVPAANVVGTVKWHLPYMGYITDKVRTPGGFLLLIGLPAAFVILSEVQNIARQMRKPRPGKEVAS